MKILFGQKRRKLYPLHLVMRDIGKTVADRWQYLVKSCGLSREQIEAMAPAFFCEPGNLITLHFTFDDLQALAIMQALFLLSKCISL